MASAELERVAAKILKSSATMIGSFTEPPKEIMARISEAMKTGCATPAFLTSMIYWQLHRKPSWRGDSLWIPSFKTIVPGQINHRIWVQLFVTHLDKLAWVISQAIQADSKITDELAFSLFPSLFCNFIEDNVNELASRFLMHLVELCASRIQMALPFLASFICGCYAFHDRLWSSLEASNIESITERLKRAIEVASPQLHLARPFLDRLKQISRDVAVTFWIKDVLCFSLKCHGMFDEVLAYLEKLEMGSEAEEMLKCVTRYRVTNDRLCVLNVLNSRMTLCFKASTLALFLDIAKKYPAQFSATEPALDELHTFQLLYTKERPTLMANPDHIVFLPIENFIVSKESAGDSEEPKEETEQEKSFRWLWGTIKAGAARSFSEPLTLLPLIKAPLESKSRPMVRFSPMVTELLGSPDFTKTVLENDLRELQQKEHDVEQAKELNRIEKATKARATLISSLLKRVLISSCVGAFGPHFQVQSKHFSQGKVIGAIKTGLRIMDEEQLDSNWFTFPLVVANLNVVTREPLNFDSVIKALDFEGLSKLRESCLADPGLEMLTNTIGRLRCLLNRLIHAPCGYQIVLFLQLAREIEQTVHISNSYGCSNTEKDILISILPADQADITKFLSSVVRIGQIQKLLISNQIEIPELNGLEKPLSWVLGAAAHSGQFIEKLLNCLSVAFGKKST